MANSVNPDEMLCSAVSHLGLHCLLRHVCPNNYGKYSSNVCSIHFTWQKAAKVSDQTAVSVKAACFGLDIVI